MKLWIPAFLLTVVLQAQDRPLARAILKELIETNTTDSVGNNTKAAEAMAKRLLDTGFPAQDVTVLGPNDRKKNMVARLHGSGSRKPILLLGHLDVVEARREDWTSDPFQLVEKDGYFYGRGTQDMKASDAALVTAFIQYRKENWRPERDLILILTSDEEGGKFNGVEWLLKNHRNLVDAEYAINADSGGVTTANGKPVNIDIEASEKMYADFQITALNPGGHSSLPIADNAIYHIANALSRLEKSPFPFELNPVTREYFERRAVLETGQTKADMNAILQTPPDGKALSRLAADSRYNSILRTTCIATRFDAGHANNALPQTARANVNCRILPGHSAEETRQTLMKIFADPKITVKYSAIGTDFVDKAPDTPAPKAIALRPEVVKAAEQLAKTMWPGAPVIPFMDTGASDSIYTNAAGIPSYGVNGLAIDQDDVRAHGKDERIRVEAYYQSVDFFYRYLKILASN